MIPKMKRQSFEIEVCANSVISAIAAEKGGADRVELCDNLYEGGSTPSAGMIYQVKQQCSIAIFPIIRPRGGDFLYSDTEMQVMLKDIDVARQMGADGFVIGCLTAKGKVDYEKCSKLIESAKGLPITFHRAFDMCDDAFEALETIKKLDIQRILTSGQKNKAIDGTSLIAELVNVSGSDLKIMVGSGVDENNIQEIASLTNAKSFHVSLRESYESEMLFRRENLFMGGLKEIPEYAHKYTCVERLRTLNKVLEEL